MATCTEGTEAGGHCSTSTLGAQTSDVQFPSGVHGGNGQVTITYTPSGSGQGTLQVSIDNARVLEVGVNLSQLLSLDGGRAFVGFTAATSSAWENHDVGNWTFDPR